MGRLIHELARSTGSRRHPRRLFFRAQCPLGWRTGAPVPSGASSPIPTFTPIIQVAGSVGSLKVRFLQLQQIFSKIGTSQEFFLTISHSGIGWRAQPE